jgi:hypothetical protein
VALTQEQIQVGMGAAMNQIEAMCRAHELAEHGGECCPETRISTAAFVAHRIGLRSYQIEGLMYFADALRLYEAECPSCRAGKDHREG